MKKKVFFVVFFGVKALVCGLPAQRRKRASAKETFSRFSHFSPKSVVLECPKQRKNDEKCDLRGDVLGKIVQVQVRSKLGPS